MLKKIKIALLVLSYIAVFLFVSAPVQADQASTTPNQSLSQPGSSAAPASPADQSVQPNPDQTNPDQQNSDQPSPDQNALSKITFPIVELSSCNSKNECMAYCSVQANMQACMDFAQKHSLLPPKQIQRQKQFVSAIQQQGGPGGCKSFGDCKAYCDNTKHIK